jgi:hypothetical protein|tara:strand:+ start:51 stop:434 length:384 start_codon:yes stop_codon:yes gene_type:complete
MSLCNRITKDICDVLKLGDLYKYVLNDCSMSCNCFGDLCGCECETDKVDIKSEASNDDMEIAKDMLEIMCDSRAPTVHSSKDGDLSHLLDFRDKSFLKNNTNKLTFNDITSESSEDHNLNNKRCFDL